MQESKKKIHFIAIAGSVMHNLAVALKSAGHQVTGSDDDIFEPSKSTLESHGLLPKESGWYPEKITADLDTVIVGMHASASNPELLKAQELKLNIVSFPEFIYQQSLNKQRIVIAGSHGKTTITAILVHVLNFYKRKFDYVVGAKVPGLENTVQLSDAPIILIEGDEYLASPLDPTPKFLLYRHHIGIISGISWDHANVFPSEDEYVKQFDVFADQTPKGGILIYCEEDPMTMMIGKKERPDVLAISYKTHPHGTDANGQGYLTVAKEKYPLQVFGNHNYQNISAAKELLKKIGVSAEQFLKAIGSFKGAAGRLEKIASNDTFTLYKDFAHAPSKVKATVKAVKDISANREVVACYELHTFSSLNKNFLPQYKNALKDAKTAIVYINPEKVKAKNLPAITAEEVKKAFHNDSIVVFEDTQALESYLLQQSWKNKNLVMMSSGNFGGLDIKGLATKLIA